MKQRTVFHLPCSYLPWTTGGKEIYTQALAKELQQYGWINHVVLHQNPNYQEPLGQHQLDETTVHVLPPLHGATRQATYSCRPTGIPGFAKLVDDLRPDVVHFQDFSIGANLLHLELVQSAGAKTVMTYHTPGQSCLERELLYNGKTVCDGEIKLDRCTACRMGVQGIPSWVRWPLAKFSLPLTASESRWQRAFSARHMTELFADAWQTLVQKIDRIHIYADWVRDVMHRNQVPAEKLAFFRTGLPFTRQQPTFKPPPPPPGGRARVGVDDPLRLVMVGRCEHFKGQEVLIDAVKALPATRKIEVCFLGPYWDTTEYGRRCLQKIVGDRRFHAPELVPHEEIPKRLAQADALIVPSLWLETGPLVVLEGFAAGLPIVGSRLGGIAELVADGQTGLLFEPGNALDLHRCLERLDDEPDLLNQLRSRVQPPRTMHEVAADTALLYEELLQPRR